MTTLALTMFGFGAILLISGMEHVSIVETIQNILLRGVFINKQSTVTSTTSGGVQPVTMVQRTV